MVSTDNRDRDGGEVVVSKETDSFFLGLRIENELKINS